MSGYLRRLAERATGTTRPGALRPRVPSLFEPVPGWSTPDVAAMATAGSPDPGPSSGEGVVPPADPAPAPTPAIATTSGILSPQGAPKATTSAKLSDEEPGSPAPALVDPVQALAAPLVPGPARGVTVQALAAPLVPRPARGVTAHDTPHRSVATDPAVNGAAFVTPTAGAPMADGPSGFHLPVSRPTAPAAPVEPVRSAPQDDRFTVPDRPPAAMAVVLPGEPAANRVTVRHQAVAGPVSGPPATPRWSGTPALPVPEKGWELAARRPEEPTVVRVSIGRIEVRAPAPALAPAEPQPAPPPEPPVSLETYLRERIEQ